MVESSVASGVLRSDDRGVLPLRGERYHSRAFAAQEWRSVWTKSWLIVGRDVEIPEAGDFVVQEIGQESVLAVRQNDGSIRAFFNVCQHRGNRLVMSADEGSMDAFTCAYHSWTWALDGTCIGAQDPEDFARGSPCGRMRLAELRCETLGSFIWVNMDPDAVPLRQYLGELAPKLEAYQFEIMFRTQAISVKMPCNWKIVQDNFRETYHIPTAHPMGLWVNEPDYLQSDIWTYDGGHALLRTPGGVPSRYLPGGELEIAGELVADLQNWGFDPAEFAGREHETRAALIQRKREQGPARGHAHYDRLDDDQLTDTFLYSIFPNVTFTCFADAMLFLRAMPHPTDPEQCIFDTWFYATGNDDFFSRMLTASGGVAGARPEPAPREWRTFGEGSLGVILDGDAGIMEAQQRGTHSIGYRGAELSGQERRIAQYHDEIDRCIARHCGDGR